MAGRAAGAAGQRPLRGEPALQALKLADTEVQGSSALGIGDRPID
jgi:hypothetical protein